MFEIGENVFDFILFSIFGEDVILFSLKFKVVVLFFYFCDNIFGCIKEVIGFSELKEVFVVENVEVFGLFKDDMKSYYKFVDK